VAELVLGHRVLLQEVPSQHKAEQHTRRVGPSPAVVAGVAADSDGSPRRGAGWLHVSAG